LLERLLGSRKIDGIARSLIRGFTDAGPAFAQDAGEGRRCSAMTVAPLEPLGGSSLRRYQYKVIDTGKHVEEELNALGAAGWKVVGVTTKRQLFIAPPQAIILMREIERRG
jgi:hypothetical protein